MAAFKIHLLNRDGKIVESKIVRAVRHYEAIEKATLMCSSLVTWCSGYEVWRGERRIARRFEPQ
jgi:hypothetical protein